MRCLGVEGISQLVRGNRTYLSSPPLLLLPSVRRWAGQLAPEQAGPTGDDGPITYWAAGLWSRVVSYPGPRYVGCRQARHGARDVSAFRLTLSSGHGTTKAR